jgi:chromosome partitioning protein
MTYIIAIANEKGGVAKTTTAISLGAAMVETGLEVLLVDLDPQSNLSMALGVESAAIHDSMANVFLENLPPKQAIIETGIPKLDLLPSTGEIGLAERTLPSQPGFETILRKLIRNNGWNYDFIILDCPPFLGAITTNAITSADLLLMPTQAEFFSVSALRSMMNLIRAIRANGNPQLTYRLLLTLLDRRNRVHRTLSEQIRVTFGVGVLNTVIEMDTRLRESSIAGLPIIFNSPKSRSALQYRALAQEILTYVKETNQQPA